MMSKKIFKYFSLFILALVASLNVIKATDMVYDSYKVGDKITYNNMDFYVIADSDSNQDYVTLLKAEPLSVDEVNKYGNGHVNMYSSLPFLDSYKTAYNEKGFGGMAYYSSPTCGYPTVVGDNIVETGCTTDYEQSEIKFVVDAWAKDKLKLSDLKEDKTGYSTRLITKDELMENLGYHQVTQGPSTLILNSEYTPDWAYNSDYRYWTMSSLEDYSRVFIAGDDLFSTSVHTKNYVVRPVINLKKTQYKSWNAKSFKIGDIIKYNDIFFYVIKDSNDEDKIVTAIKAEPLKSSEMISLLNSTEIKDKVNTTKENITMAYYSRDNCVSAGDISGCTTDYSLSDVKQVIDVWANVNLKSSDLSVDATGYSARLITYDEYISTAEYKHIITDYGYYESIYDWMYNSNYSYWTMSSSEDSTLNVWHVQNDGSINANHVYDIVHYDVVRPVVTFAKQNYDSKTIDNSPTKVSVPDTLLNMPVLGVIIGIFILIISLIIIYLILKNKRKNIKS